MTKRHPSIEDLINFLKGFYSKNCNADAGYEFKCQLEMEEEKTHKSSEGAREQETNGGLLLKALSLSY